MSARTELVEPQLIDENDEKLRFSFHPAPYFVATIQFRRRRPRVRRDSTEKRALQRCCVLPLRPRGSSAMRATPGIPASGYECRPSDGPPAQARAGFQRT